MTTLKQTIENYLTYCAYQKKLSGSASLNGNITGNDTNWIIPVSISSITKCANSLLHKKLA